MSCWWKGLEKGTLVEYVSGCGFEKEWGRAEIVSSEVMDGSIKIMTTGEAHLAYDQPGQISVRTDHSGVTYLDVPGMWCYAVAPEGVAIPASQRTATSEVRGLQYE